MSADSISDGICDNVVDNDGGRIGDRFVDADDGIRDNAGPQQGLGDRMGNRGH